MFQKHCHRPYDGGTGGIRFLRTEVRNSDIAAQRRLTVPSYNTLFFSRTVSSFNDIVSLLLLLLLMMMIMLLLMMVALREERGLLIDSGLDMLRHVSDPDIRR